MLGNGILETTTVTGTGDLTIAAVTGRPRFSTVFTSNASEASADLFYYAILDQSNPPQIIEVGKGWLSDANTLKRAEILATLSGSTYDNTAPTAISLAAGTKNVICTGEASSFQPSMPNINATSGSTERGVAATLYAAQAGGTLTVTKDRLFYLPFMWAVTQEVAAVKFKLATAGSGSNTVRVGIYNCNRQGYPGRLVAESGNIDCTTGGGTVKSGTFSSRRLPAGWYFAAFASGLGTTQPAVTCTSTGTLLNFPTPLGLQSSDLFPYAWAYEGLSANWTQLPANASGSLSMQTLGTSNLPWMGVCIA